MTPAAFIRAQAMRTPFRRLGKRRARWLAWRATDGAPIIGPGWKRKARRMLARMNAKDFEWVYVSYAGRESQCNRWLVLLSRWSKTR